MTRRRCHIQCHDTRQRRHGDVFISCDGLAHVVEYDFTTHSLCREVWWHKDAKTPTCFACILKMGELSP